MQSPDSQPTKFTAPLKVVPPQRQAPAPATPTQNAPPPQDPPKGPIPSTLDPNSEDPLGWVKQSLKIGAACVAVGAITLIPVGDSTKAPGILQVKPQDTKVYPGTSGKVMQYLVQEGQQVTIGTPIARMETPDLDEQILDEQRRLQDYERQLNQLKSQSFFFQARELEVQQATKNSAVETAMLNQRANGQAAEIIRLNHQKSAITHRIQSLEDEVNHLQGERTRALEQLADYRKANQDGHSVGSVIPRNLIRDQESKVSNFENLIMTKRSQIKEFEDELNGKDAEIMILRNTWSDDATRTEGQTHQSKAAEMTVRQQFYGNQQELMDLSQSIQLSQNKLAELEQKRNDGYIIKSDKVGQVLTNNFYEFLGRRMQENESIIEVADTSYLDAVIQVSQVDASRNLIKVGANIEITFPEDSYNPINTKIVSIDPQFQPDATGQKQLKIVRATIDNSNGDYLVSQQIKVRIMGEKIPLYRKVWLEIRKHTQW